jgi:EAL domain-containing protein (putative c-di-GMP-specific phosphodiesterase class I)
MIKSLKDLLDKLSRFTNSLVYDGGICKRLKSIVLFCKQQNIKIVAEFVSDLKILRYVKNIQIDYSQGYYISKPKSISEIILERENEKRTKKNN